MAGTTLTLTEPTIGELSLTADEGIHVTNFDVGWPVTRKVVNDRPSQDGSDNHTRFHGARTLTLKVVAVETTGRAMWELVDRLGRYCHPARRSSLLIDTPGRVPRRIDLVVDQWSAPQTGGATRQIQVSWDVPAGVIVDDTPTVSDLTLVGAAMTGRTYPLVYDRTYPAGAPDTGTEVTNPGSAAAHWHLRIYGPVTNPTVTINGDPWVAAALTVAAGDYLALRSDDRTVTLNDDPGAPRRDKLDFAATTWTLLEPGTSTLNLTGTGTGAGTMATLEWRPTWMI